MNLFVWLVLLFCGALGTARAVGAEEVVPGPVAAAVLEVIDGDTLAVRAHIWLGQNVETRVRLAEIDTPELNGDCAHERQLADRARQMVIGLIGDAGVVLEQIRFGKYAGRVVARVRTEDGLGLADLLIQSGLAKPYHGRKRGDWCGQPRPGESALK